MLTILRRDMFTTRATIPMVLALLCQTALLVGCGSYGGTQTSTSTAPSARFAYVINSTDNTISIFAKDAKGGQLRLNEIVPTGGTNPASIKAVPSGQFLYVANFGSDTISAFRINASTGELTAINRP